MELEVSGRKVRMSSGKDYCLLFHTVLVSNVDLFFTSSLILLDQNVYSLYAWALHEQYIFKVWNSEVYIFSVV